jgi:hypothetical protein
MRRRARRCGGNSWTNFASRSNRGNTMPRKPKQPYLSPEMEPPSHPVIDEAASQYVECRDARMAALKQEVAAHDALLSLMKAKKLTAYAFEGFNVSLDSKEKVKVRRKKDEAAGDEE